MNFKPAICPSCSGNLQIPNNLKIVKCMYCGLDVIVQEAIQLAGRVKNFTEATAIEKLEERIPFDEKQAKSSSYIIPLNLLLFGFLISFLWGGSIGVILFIIIAICAVACFIAWRVHIKNLKAESDELMKQPIKADTVGYRGHCPYCDTSIELSSEKLGDDCPACQKRIIIRDSKFYSVDTPISSLK